MPSRDMNREAAGAGLYNNEYYELDKIKIVTVEQILNGDRLRIPLIADVIKKAVQHSNPLQLTL
jgi:hypothetical protein